MKYKIKAFFRRVYNLYRWLPVIWKDQDWDDWYIFEILKFKLKNQAEYISSHDRHVGAKRDAQIMMTCVRLIEKIQEEYYSGEYMEYHKADYKWIDSSKYPDYYQLEIVETSERFDEYFKKYPHTHRKVLENKNNIFRTEGKRVVAMNMGHMNEEKAHRILFTLLERNIRRWWD